MALLIALHRPAEDSEKYQQHYFDVHVPLAKALPGLRRYQVSRGPITDYDGNKIAELVALLEFDSKDALMEAVSGREGEAALEDLPNFAKPDQIDLMVVESLETL